MLILRWENMFPPEKNAWEKPHYQKSYGFYKQIYNTKSLNDETSKDFDLTYKIQFVHFSKKRLLCKFKHSCAFPFIYML